LEAVLKRRRLAAGGVENHNPEQRALRSPARSRRLESEVKPDTPAIASVRLRVQQFIQRRDVGAALVQRCMSDPGTESPSSTLLQDVCHIGEGEFSSRVERFKTTTPESSPIPTTPSTRQLSSFVHNMQQQLNTTMTPSTKEVSRIRQAREDELKSLRVKPLTENMWLKRSFSDPSLTERVTPPSSSCVCQRTRKIPWPPLQFENDDQEPECSLNFSGMNEMTGDSFSGSSTFTAETQPSATELCPPESVASPHEGMSTSALIDKMFEDVLQAADREEEEEQGEEEQEEEEQEEEEQEEEEQEEEEQGNDRLASDSKDDTNVETAESKVKPSFGGDEEQKECKTSNEKEVTGDGEESVVCNEEDFLSLPPSCVLSPLSKSVEAVVTPMRLTTTVPPPMVPCVPAEDVATPPAPPLYSIDAYRSQRKIPPPSSQSVTPGVQKQRAEQSHVKPAINTKETIKVCCINNS
ncbi:anillin isoform X1, partial [Tachysurus ichikawai]